MSFEESQAIAGRFAATGKPAVSRGQGTTYTGNGLESEFSFLDLLSALQFSGIGEAGDAGESRADTPGAPPAEKSKLVLKAGISTTSASNTQAVDKPTASQNAGGVTKSVAGKSTAPTNDEGDAELKLLFDALTPADKRFIQQVIIPNIPLPATTVPFQTFFTPPDSGVEGYVRLDAQSPLAEMIQAGYRTGRPFRVELDDKSSIVLKITNGRVSAEFVSSDRGMALLMQQELTQLRQKLLQKNLPVNTLEARYQQGQQQPQHSFPHHEPDDTDSV